MEKTMQFITVPASIVRSQFEEESSHWNWEHLDAREIVFFEDGSAYSCAPGEGGQIDTEGDVALDESGWCGAGTNFPTWEEWKAEVARHFIYKDGPFEKEGVYFCPATGKAFDFSPERECHTFGHIPQKLQEVTYPSEWKMSSWVDEYHYISIPILVKEFFHQDYRDTTGDGEPRMTSCEVSISGGVVIVTSCREGDDDVIVAASSPSDLPGDALCRAIFWHKLPEPIKEAFGL